VGRNRATVAQTPVVAERRSATGLRSGLFGGDHFHSQNRRALEYAAAGDGVWQRGHLLAAAAGMDPAGHLARVASPSFASPRKTWLAPTFTGGDRHGFSARGFWGVHTGPNRTDRSKNGCKRHVITDARGVPLVVATGPANEPDGKRALELLDKIPAVEGRRGRPRRKPKIFQGDAAYGSAAMIRQVSRRGIQPALAPYGRTKRSHGSGLGATRYVVERTMSWFGNFRRLKICYERTWEHLQAFHELAACLICARKVQPART